MASSSLRALTRLVASTHKKPLVDGFANPGVRRSFGTSPKLANPDDDVYNKRPFHTYIWKRKFSWIIAITLVGTVIFEFFHPDKERRSKAIIKDWQHKTQGGAYNPRLPQKENPVATPKTDTETEKKD